MTSSLHFQRVEALFLAALELAPEQRRAFLERETPDDAEVRDEVARLLFADSGAGDFIQDAVRQEARLWHLEAAPDRIAGFEIIGVIGEGGFGVVWEGRAADGRRVAIKTCPSKDRTLARRFVREAQIASRLVHPRIVAVHAFGEENGLPYLVQELLPGEDLAVEIGAEVPMPFERATPILLQIAEGLEFAHAEGVLHRDVTPSNIRLLPNGLVKLMDFGIAKLVRDDSIITATGVTLGTMGYLAPEQLLHEELGPYTDIFVFGILAYELLTGERPFVGRTIGAVSHAVLNELPAPMYERRPDCPRALEKLVLDCLEKKPERRPPSFSQIREELASVATRLGVGPRYGAPHPRTEEIRRRTRAFDRRLVLGLLTLLVAALTLLVLGL